MRPSKPICHGDMEFTSLKAMADYHGVKSSSICVNICTGIWRGEILYYVKEYKPSRPNPSHIETKQFRWLYANKPDGCSVDDFLSSIISDAMKEAA